MVRTSIFLTLSAVGIVNTLYLSYHALKKTHVRCWGFPQEWCDKVQYSVYSTTFGIPNPYAGLAMYSILFLLTLLYGLGQAPWWPIVLITTIGFLFSLYFTYVQAVTIRAFCTWCVVSALDFTLLFIALLFSI